MGLPLGWMMAAQTPLTCVLVPAPAAVAHMQAAHHLHVEQYDDNVLWLVVQQQATTEMSGPGHARMAPMILATSEQANKCTLWRAHVLPTEKHASKNQGQHQVEVSSWDALLCLERSKACCSWRSSSCDGCCKRVSKDVGPADCLV